MKMDGLLLGAMEFVPEVRTVRQDYFSYITDEENADNRKNIAR